MQKNVDISDHIAVIGMACRFPGANDIETFWELLHDSRENIYRFTEKDFKRLNIQENYFKNPNYVKAYGTLDNLDQFDAKFFHYSPFEASLTDPQHRIFLELAWIALETAGYAPSKYVGLIGVYAGCTDSTYFLENILNVSQIKEKINYHQLLLAISNVFLATKISYKLNLKGPSLNINTACSTSLVAIITACQQLQNFECDMALAGGVSIHLPQTGYLYQPEGILSPDGHCRAFDAKAKGTVPANGAGIVVLKRLEDALADKDHIDAVIIGSAINNDGADKVGFTAPSVIGQTTCIQNALELANVSPETITYVEAHGTGTALGDPIEIAALTKAYRQYTNKKQFCAIGSVKTNIGHTNCAAGVAGFIKTVLALKHREIPANLHFKKPNPKIDFENSPFYINKKLTKWHSKKNSPRRAGVSSFGLGGTNAHIILEEPPPIEKQQQERDKVYILPLSAKTEYALKKKIENFSEYLFYSKANLTDIVFTANSGRENFE